MSRQSEFDTSNTFFFVENISIPARLCQKEDDLLCLLTIKVIKHLSSQVMSTFFDFSQHCLQRKIGNDGFGTTRVGHNDQTGYRSSM